MAFNLLNFLKGVAADINPFDGGKSHGNMSGAPRPASTAQPSQQQQVVASTQNRPQPQHKSLWQQALDVAAAPQNALQHLGSSFANEVKTNPANIVAHASPLVGGIVDTVNSGLNALHTNPQLEANVNQAADTAARRLTNAAANLPQSHLGETRFSGNPWINTPAQFAASVPDAFLNMPSNAGKTIAGLATYGRDLLSQGTDNPVQTNQALANVAQTANNAFNTAAPVAGAGSVAETLTKAGVEKTIPQKLLSAALESGKQGGAYGGFGGFTQGYAENPNAPVTTQLVSGVKSGVEQAATNALLASALGSGGEALNLGVRGVIDRVTAPKPVTTNLVPKPIYNNVNHVAAGVPEGGQFAKKPVDLKAQQAADLAASEARAIDPNVQARRVAMEAPRNVAPAQPRINMHPDDQRILADFNDIANGVYTPDPRLQRQIELDATRIAEKHGIPLKNTTQEQADVFDNVLQRGVTKPEFAPKPPRATQQLAPKSNDPLEALKAEARKYKSADEFVKSDLVNKNKFDGLDTEEYSPTIADVIANKSVSRKGMVFENGFDPYRASVDPKKLLSPNAEVKNGKVRIYRISEEGGIKPGDYITDNPKYIYGDESFLVNKDGMMGVYKRQGVSNPKVDEAWVSVEDVVNPDADLVLAGKASGKPGEFYYVPKNFTKDSLTDLYNQAVGSKATKPKAYYQNVPKSYTEPKKPVDLDTLKADLDKTREKVRLADKKLSDEFRSKSKNMTDEQKSALMKEYQAKFESMNVRKQQKSIESSIEGLKKSETPDTKTTSEVKRLVKESYSQNDYDPASKGYFIDLSSDNIKGVTPLKGIDDYGDTMYVSTNAGVSSVRIQDWSESGQGFRVSNGNGNEIARFNTDAEAREFARKALTIENEAKRQGKRVILSGSKVENRATAEVKPTTFEKNTGIKAPTKPKAVELSPSDTKLLKEASAPIKNVTARDRAEMKFIDSQESGVTLPKAPTLKSAPRPKTAFEQNTGVVAPTRDYIKQQTKLQEAAAKGERGSKVAKVKNELSTKGLDALSAIEKPVEIAAGGRKNTVALRNQLDRSLRADTIAGQYAKDNGLHDIIKSVDDTKAFDQYLIARHGQDLTANGVKTGRNAAQDAQLLKDLSPKYEAQAKALGEYNNKLLDKTVEYGLISKDTSKYLKDKYPNYVPFDRIFSEGELSGMGNGAGPASLSKQTIIQRIKGSDRQVSSPLESILAKTRDIHAQGERNLAAQQIAKTIDLPGNPLSLKEIKPTETIGNRSTISFIENGKKRTFETTPEVAQAAKSLNRQQLGVVEKVLSYPTRVLRLGATGVNVGFAGANVVKDAASAFINSEHPLQASIANPKVFLKSLSAAFNHSGKAYSELVREGAGGTSFDIARNAAKDTVGKIRAERSGVSKVLHTVKSPSELLRAVEDTIGRSEEFGRAVQYFGNKSAALREGKTVAEATAYGADAARNNTVNFARAGEYGRVVNSVLPYVNAGVQGSRTLMRNLRDRPTQTATKIAITGFFPVAVTTAYALSDPKRKAAYDDIQDYEKQGNIIIVPPNPKKDPKTGRWNVIKIPVSQEIANLNNVVRNGIEALHKDKSFDFAAMAGELAGTATSLNLGSPRQALGQVIPQGLKPAIEALTNKNLFTGNDIVPKSQQALDAKDQYGDYTSGTAKTLGNVTGMSPRQIDNFIRTTTGGAGQTALNASDNLLAKAGVIKPEEVRGMNLGNSVSNRFNSAAGLSEYATADKAIEDKTKQLKATAEYKALDPTEKAAALSRLTQDVFKANKLAIDAKNQKPGWGTDKNGKQIKLSERQAGLLDGKTDIRDYLTTNAQKEAMGISTSTTKASNPKDRYQKALDQYNKDKKAGKVSEVNDPTRQKELAALKVKSNFDQDTVDLYGKSYKDIIGFVNTSQNGKKLWEQVKALDKATVDAGGTSKLYDKYGNLKKTTTGSTASKKAKKGKYTFANTQVKGTDLKALSTMLKGISKPKNSKAIALKTYSPKKATISKRSA